MKKQFAYICRLWVQRPTDLNESCALQGTRAQCERMAKQYAHMGYKTRIE